jgi:anti-sigma factor RsiW
MNIESIRALLPDYLAGTLSDAERAEVERALASSSQLRAEVEELSAVFDTFPAHRLRQLVEQRSRSLSIAVSQQVAAAEHRMRRWHWPIAATLLAAAALAGVMLLKPTKSTRPASVLLNRDPQTPAVNMVTESTVVVPSTVTPMQPKPTARRRPIASAYGELHLDALALATFPDDAIDSQFVEQFVEVFNDATDL